MNKSIRLVSLMMLTAAIAGCGGGGGDAGAPPVGGPSPAPAPGPAPGPAPAPTPGTPPAPTQQTTGLGAPNLELGTSTDPATVAAEFGLLAREMRDAYEVADDAQAAREASLLSPGVIGIVPASFNCPGVAGGTITITQQGGGILGYTYNSCNTNGYTYSGTATVTPANLGATYNIQLNGVSFTGPDGHSGTLSGSSSCVSGAPTQCVTTQGGFKWGFDISYVSALANGTHQCNCGAQGTWNVVFDDFGATSGTAYVYANNGTAIVKRTGDKTFSVTRQIGTTLFSDVPLTLP